MINLDRKIVESSFKKEKSCHQFDMRNAKIGESISIKRYENYVCLEDDNGQIINLHTDHYAKINVKIVIEVDNYLE